MKYRKKPVVIEAHRWTGENVAQMMDFIGASWSWDDKPGGSLFIETLEGEMEAKSGDWIIRGVAGEYYPCKPDIFEQTYEPVDDAK